MDVTIVYPDNVRGFWAFACGNIREIRVSVRHLAISPELMGDYNADPRFRESFQSWLNATWAEKDEIFEGLTLETPR